MVESEKDISLFCDVDENGMITHMLIGKYVNPISEYEYFFKIDKNQEANIDNYYIKDRKLTLKEGTTSSKEAPDEPTETVN